MYLSLPLMVGRILLKSIKDSDYRKHFLHRFGIYENAHNLKDIVWFHAVSLGEVISSQNIVKTIAMDNNVVLSVTTPTGLREAKKIFGLDIEIVTDKTTSLSFAIVLTIFCDDMTSPRLTA